jgi:hypothetical protein
MVKAPVLHLLLNLGFIYLTLDLINCKQDDQLVPLALELHHPLNYVQIPLQTQGCNFNYSAEV